MSSLALLGGNAVASHDWPRWPQPGERALPLLADVLNSGRWTVSCPSRGVPSYEQRFAEAYARFCQARFCIPTASGTASLAIALEACGVGAGDEVIVPGLSWVASASAVLGINAVPVLVDVDPASYCVDPAAVKGAITSRTRAITLVHAYSAIADVDALAAVASDSGLPLVEDCAHAHGARFQDRPVGLSGAAGAFSMQGSKLLTSGEGGAIVTDDAEIANRAEHLRADGRTRSRGTVPAGQMELIETAELMGSNACLSEFHAAVLLDQLDLLEAQNATRAAAAQQLTERLAGLGLRAQQTSPGTTRRTYYRYTVQVPDEALSIAPLPRLAEAISAELGFPVTPTYPPLNDNPLHRPSSRRRFAADPDYLLRVSPAQFPLPAAKHIHDSVLTIGHEVLLAEPEHIEEIALAVEKVLANISQLARRQPA
ncbi:MAG TPA: aminotransferase class I/II-fold pyridoxal phosphate-dependent enzyme [Streptosporangiaceae bacterium]